MPISLPCPKCQAPLSIPEPTPEKVQCPKCGVAIKLKAAAPAAVKPQSTPDIAIGKPAYPAKAPAPPAADETPIELIDEPTPTPKAPAPTRPSAPVEQDASSSMLSYIHAVIPKPIVFGTYGAIGGFLGVLLLGELLWLILHPTPQDVKPLIVAVSEEVKLFPGSRGKVKVKIARQGFEGPVRLEALDVPDVLQIPEVTIGEKETEAEVPIEAIVQAEEDQQYKVTLRATADKEKIAVKEPFTIYIRPIPPSMGLSVSEQVTVFAGGQNRFGFQLARKRFEGFAGATRVEVLDLPKGVHVPIVMVPAKGANGFMTVAADKDAKIGAFVLDAEVRALADHTVATKAKFQLNVLPPPGKLQVAAPAAVTVFPGTKNRFRVKIARADFTGPIRIEVTGAPRGVLFSSADIPADKAEAEIEVAASKDIEAGGPPTKGLMVTGKLLSDKEDISTAMPLQLNLVPPPPAVQLAVAPKVPVYPGSKATFGVKIHRARFKGPVQIVVQGGNPGFVSIPPIIIAPDKTEAELTVNVSTAALGLRLKHTMPIQVVARKADGQGIPAIEKVDIEILPPPSDLQLTVSPEVEVYQAGKCSFTVKVARGGFIGPVEIKFNNVPAGVTLTPGFIAGNEVVLRGAATIDADPKKHVIEIIATGPKAPDGKVPTVRDKFNLTVKPFDPAIRPPLDIVFVLDVTQSLDPQIAGVRDGIGQFLKGLKDRDLDARIGLIAFRDITVPDEVHFEELKFKGDKFTTDANAFAAEVGKLKASGGGDDPESSLDAIVRASKYPFRPKSLKVLLLITDNKPQTKGNSVTMKIAQAAVRDHKIGQVHLIVKKKDLPDYAGLHQAAKGAVFDFDQATGAKGKENFAAILPMLSKEIVTTIGAPDPVAKAPGQPDVAPPPPALTGETTPEPRAEAIPTSPVPQVPAPPIAGQASIAPASDPRPPEADAVSPPVADAPTISGLQSSARYAEKDRGWLLAASALWTAALAAGVALMLVGAQKRYLSQSLPRVSEIAKSIAAGLASGLLAGIVSQWLFLQFSSGAAWWEGVTRVIGWMLMGGLIGGAMGLFVPNMNWKRAFIGGCVGGLIGVLGYLLADAVLGRFIGGGFAGFLGRLFGAALVGLCIGLMVALAEIASRRYWLEVAFGEREIRTVTLGAATVAVGGDEKLAAVYVPNAPAKAFGFRIDRNRVFCEDFTTGKTTEAAAGDQHTVANAKIRICSAAVATPTGANLKLVVARDLPLMIGMPLTADDIPGLEPQGADGIVALVSRRPNNPKIFLLRNRSKQAWTVTEPDGKQRKIDPGLSIELSSKCEIDFGQVKATLDPSTAAPGEK